MHAGLGEIEVDLKRTDFYITHMHADHIGLVPRLVEDTATVYINRPDKEYMEYIENGAAGKRLPALPG